MPPKTRKRKDPKWQEQIFNGTQTSQPPHFEGQQPPPIQQPIQDPGPSTSKRVKTATSNEEKEGAFRRSIENYIRSKLQKKPVDQFDAFKRECYQYQQLPTNICSNAARELNIPYTEMYNYLKSNPTRRVIELFEDHVGRSFETIKNNLLKTEGDDDEPESTVDTAELETASKREGTTESSGSVSELRSKLSDLDTASLMDVDVEESAPKAYATCTTSLQSILRRDLNFNIKKTFESTIAETMLDVSDLVADFSAAVLALLITFKSHECYQEGASLLFRRKDGFEIATILPDTFEPQSNVQFSVPQWPTSLTASTLFDREFKDLFTAAHLRFIRTAFLSKRSTKQPKQLQDALNQLLPESLKEKLQKHQTIPVPIRDIALEQYITNFDNMWNSKYLINKALNKVLDVLLKLHLAPVRQQQYVDYVNTKKEENTRQIQEQLNDTNIAYLPRDHRRSIIRDEEYKMKKYAKKENETEDQEKQKWERRRIQAENRIAGMKRDINELTKNKPRKQPDVPQANIDSAIIAEVNGEITVEEVVELEDEATTQSTDTPRRRLQQLKSVIRNMIFKTQSTPVTQEAIVEICPDASNNEIAVCQIILNSLLPYIPPRRKYHITAYQIPFVLLVNDILRAAGYSGSTFNVCPMPTSSNIQSLRLDSASIFSAFASNTQKITKPKNRNFLVAGAWNMNDSSIGDFANMVNGFSSPSNVDVVVSSAIQPAVNIRQDFNVAARDNAFTSTNIKWVILGHDTRPDELLGEKVTLAPTNRASVIVCINENLQDHEANTANESFDRQMRSIYERIDNNWMNVVIAYKPIWAVDDNNAIVTPEQVENVHRYLREWLANNVSQPAANKTRVIYGGPVNTGNCKKFARMDNVDGFLISGASVEPDFEIFLNAKQPIVVYDFEGKRIVSEQRATELKHPMFNTFFSISSIFRTCQKSKLDFANNITILPGGQYVRILGTKRKPGIVEESSEATGNNVPWEAILDIQRTRNDDQLRTEILDYERTIQQLTTALKREREQMNERDYSGQIKTARAQARSSGSGSGNVKRLQQERYDSYQIIEREKLQLKQARYDQYLRKKALSTRGSIPRGRQRTTKDVTGAPCIDKAENMRLPKDRKLADDFTFCGTDNGLVKLTETIPVDFQKFRYHLELHNRYSLLANVEEQEEVEDEPTPALVAAFDPMTPALTPRQAQEEELTPAAFDPGTSQEHLPFEELPGTHAIYPGDVDFRCNYFRDRMRLEKRKKTGVGLQITQIETELKDYGLHTANTVDELERYHEQRQIGKNIRRNFYYGKSETRLKQKTELIAKKQKDKLCSEERRFSKNKSKKSLVMLIGDRGFCYGSSLKGHRRYGGYWKQENHARYTTVCVTNENNTSQTCVYCFQKLHHPQKKVQVRGVEQKRNVNGSFICFNPDCPSFVSHRNTQTRDKVSAMAIALSGISTLVFSQTFPEFATKTSQFDTGEFKKQTIDLLHRSASWAGSGAL